MLPLLALPIGDNDGLLLLNPSKYPATMEEIRNRVMMDTLMRLPWFREYRAKLQDYYNGLGSRPSFPHRLVQGAQDVIDLLIHAVRQR